MNTIRNTFADIWDSLLGRLAIFALSFGAVPFYFMTCATEALQK